MITSQWFWMMMYCAKRKIPTAQSWALEEARKAYLKELNNGRD